MKYFELEVWQKAVELSISVYKFTAAMPKEETYGLRAQMRRCAVSIPSNIAEGEGRESRKERHQFLSVARGSLFELLTQTLIAERLGFVETPLAGRLHDDANEVGRLLTGSIRQAKKPLIGENKTANR